MGEEILSAEELDALLSTVEDVGAGKRRREKRILEYDFVRPNKLSGEQLRSLQRMHEAIAQNITMALSSYLRLNLEVNILSLGELTFEVFRNSLPNPTMINVLSMAPIQEKGIATMDMKLAFSLIDRMLGGPGKPLEKMRSLTTIEQSLLDNVIKRFLDQVANGWRELVTFQTVVESREMDPQFVQVIPSSEMVLVATFSVAAPGELEPGELCFSIPFISLENTITRLGNQFRFAAMKRSQSPGQRRHLNRVVQQTTLEVTCELGTTKLSIGDIIDLKVGDVLVLDQAHDALLSGRVAGRDRILGRPGIIGRKAGFLVDTVIPSEGMTVEKRSP
jgi:flagellar motor switch protein FliM